MALQRWLDRVQMDDHLGIPAVAEPGANTGQFQRLAPLEHLLQPVPQRLVVALQADDFIGQAVDQLVPTVAQSRLHGGVDLCQTAFDVKQRPGVVECAEGRKMDRPDPLKCPLKVTPVCRFQRHLGFHRQRTVHQLTQVARTLVVEAGDDADFVTTRLVEHDVQRRLGIGLQRQGLGNTLEGVDDQCAQRPEMSSRAITTPPPVSTSTCLNR